MQKVCACIFFFLAFVYIYIKMNNFESIHSSLDFNENLLETNPFADAVPTGSGSIEPADTQHSHDIEQQTTFEQQTTMNEQQIEEEQTIEQEESSEMIEQLQQVDINKTSSLDTSSIEDTQVRFHFYK